MNVSGALSRSARFRSCSDWPTSWRVTSATPVAAVVTTTPCLLNWGESRPAILSCASLFPRRAEKMSA